MIKTTVLTALASICVIATANAKAKAQPASGPWQQADSIVNAIKKTSFPDRVYNIADFGAKAVVPKRRLALAHDAINLAIVTCSQEGGGTVVIPDSTYITGPITMLSNVNLHLSDGAVLKFSTEPNLYFPAVLTRWEGLDCYNTHPLIYAYGCTNIAITGKGMLDAQATNDNWWAMCGAEHFGWSDGKVSQRNGSRDKLLQWGEKQTPVYLRQFTVTDGMRPQFVNLYRCTQVLIEDITLESSPFWVIHPLFCNDLIVRRVKVNNHGPNGDGCDPESCNRVLIEGCTFNTGDDCIAIKSGRNTDGRKWDTPSQNIVVRDCHFADGHGGVVIGSEISGGYRNLFVENCTMDSPNLDRVIRIKTSSCRGGTIENIYVRNVEVGQCREAVLRINLDYEHNEACNRGNNPVVRNVNLENVNCKKSRFGIYLIGLEDECNLYDVNVTNCRWTNVEKGRHNLRGKYRGIRQTDVSLNGEKSPAIPDVL